jgi:hypothetical protein
MKTFLPKHKEEKLQVIKYKPKISDTHIYALANSISEVLAKALASPDLEYFIWRIQLLSKAINESGKVNFNLWNKCAKMKGILLI